MYRTLMVPLDGSAFGEHALPLALTIARRSGAAVHLAHVCVPPSPHDLVHLLHPDSDDLSMQARIRLYLDQLATNLSERWEVPITTSVLVGPVVPTLREHALALGADMVVLTTHGRGSLARLAVGSVADALVRSLPLPVLLTRPRDGVLDLLESAYERVCRRVLIPLDGSALAEAVLEPAVAFGQLFDAEYTLLQAVDPPLLGYALTAHATGIDQRALDVWREESLGYLEQVAQRLRERQLQVKTDIALGYAPQAILEYAHEHTFDLIALATHGRSGVARMLMGSTADAVVCRSSTPVLVIRPPAITERREPAEHEMLERIPT
ncbi:MAG: universal stress protein [Chloroflexota bacterium]|nr:MAG: universal stress protein [Chloroflexota bacterium]